MVIPARNEAPRVGAVLEAAQQLPGVEVVLVDDASRDGTADAARRVPGVRLLRLDENLGKGGAVWQGILAAREPVVLLLDADLSGLDASHLGQLAAPVLCGEAEMCVARFVGGRGKTDFSHRLTPWVSGQRALPRRLLLSLPEVAECRLGLEALLTRAAELRGWRVTSVPWQGVTHAMKEEKLGGLRGTLARWGMYRQMYRGWTRFPLCHDSGDDAP